MVSSAEKSLILSATAHTSQCEKINFFIFAQFLYHSFKVARILKHLSHIKGNSGEYNVILHWHVNKIHTLKIQLYLKSRNY